MTLVIQCEACQRRYQVKDTLAGKTVRCAKCGAPITIAPPDSADTDASAAGDDAGEHLEQLEAEDAGRWAELTDEEPAEDSRQNAEPSYGEAAPAGPAMTVAEIVRPEEPPAAPDLSALLDEVLPDEPAAEPAPPPPAKKGWWGRRPATRRPWGLRCSWPFWRD